MSLKHALGLRTNHGLVQGVFQKWSKHIGFERNNQGKGPHMPSQKGVCYNGFIEKPNRQHEQADKGNPRFDFARKQIPFTKNSYELPLMCQRVKKTTSKKRFVHRRMFWPLQIFFFGHRHGFVWARACVIMHNTLCLWKKNWAVHALLCGLLRFNRKTAGTVCFR